MKPLFSWIQEHSFSIYFVVLLITLAGIITYNARIVPYKESLEETTEAIKIESEATYFYRNGMKYMLIQNGSDIEIVNLSLDSIIFYNR